MILENIHSREDLLRLDKKGDEQLCRELRQFLIDHVSQTGGHLASNLGLVETTLAIQKPLTPAATDWSLMWDTSPTFTKS